MPQSEHLATITLLSGDNGIEAKVETELHEGELGEILHVIADQMTEVERPRAAGAWGYRPER